ncbi:uncharacterized protein LOC110880496 [Helianthus annuus]|uniref:uncharacterized protein LOC110880496 n=1 Tax=Helianthus annuus TaxID=4232 RepID=UPI000B8F4060|nr:uncharacterized protein LOC110880496 [Helianthus annuus]
MSSIAREIQPMIESNPNMPIQAIQSQLLRKHQLEISLHKVFRAKRITTTNIYGDYQEQYGLLRSYCDDLLKANPGSTIKIDVEPCGNSTSPTRQFRRVYFCFASMMRGFKMIGRPLLGVDGCFMKGPFPGQILSVVGIDGNNSIYPVCYALVEAETTQTCKWFLQLLRDDLGCTANSCFTFIGDRQKCLIPAMLAVFPNAEHIFCLRHIHENMKSKWRGDLYKNLLWSAGRKKSIPYFNKAMEEIKTTKRAMKWDLTGMPCIQAVAAIWDMSRNNIDVGIPEDWMDEPINGSEMWTPSECPTTLIPPKHHTQVGRPKKKRKKAYGEKELEQEFDKGGKMTRKGSSIKCGKCGNMGHNVRSCKGQGGEQSTASQESHTATQGAPIYNLHE